MSQLSMLGLMQAGMPGTPAPMSEEERKRLRAAPPPGNLQLQGPPPPGETAMPALPLPQQQPQAPPPPPAPRASTPPAVGASDAPAAAPGGPGWQGVPGLPAPGQVQPSAMFKPDPASMARGFQDFKGQMGYPGEAPHVGASSSTQIPMAPDPFAGMLNGPLQAPWQYHPSVVNAAMSADQQRYASLQQALGQHDPLIGQAMDMNARALQQHIDRPMKDYAALQGPVAQLDAARMGEMAGLQKQALSNTGQEKVARISAMAHVAGLRNANFANWLAANPNAGADEIARQAQRFSAGESLLNEGRLDNLGGGAAAAPADSTAPPLPGGITGASGMAAPAPRPRPRSAIDQLKDLETRTRAAPSGAAVKVLEDDITALNEKGKLKLDLDTILSRVDEKMLADPQVLDRIVAAIRNRGATALPDIIDELKRGLVRHGRASGILGSEEGMAGQFGPMTVRAGAPGFLSNRWEFKGDGLKPRVEEERSGAFGGWDNFFSTSGGTEKAKAAKKAQIMGEILHRLLRTQ